MEGEVTIGSVIKKKNYFRDKNYKLRMTYTAIFLLFIPLMTLNDKAGIQPSLTC